MLLNIYFFGKILWAHVFNMTLKIWEPVQFHVPKTLTPPAPRSGSLKIPETKGQDYSGLKKKLVNSQCILWPVFLKKK
jgi:hypothetical protein